ncbi:MAG TPA: TIGR01244 family sulfur transferase [Microvirga sp.]|jgi:uncharacterized protein (TIGR01244 family)|nr:TIGR01244 family sulfur transferase [Microvirga sp.]
MSPLPRKRTVFFAALLIGASTVLIPAAWSRWVEGVPSRSATPEASAALVERHQLKGDVWVAGQIEARDIAAARARGFKTVIALRPDGEAADQASSTEMGRLARAHGMTFTYIPVPHGDLPDEVADALGRTLASADGPVLLYCRSGRRAARAWAVAEASRRGGMTPEAIHAAAAAAGHPVDDLSDRIAQRTAHRTAPRG